MSAGNDETVPFNEVQGIASTIVTAYSNQYDDFISFEETYTHGIFTGYKWQCVEFARRWLLLRKSCTFRSFPCAADMWLDMAHVERVTDGQQFLTRTYANGSSHKPRCDSFLIYPRGQEIPYGHIAVICDVQETFIRVTEQNYRFLRWRDGYARQIPLVCRDGCYYIEDYYPVYGWLEIERDDQLEPFDESKCSSILEKYTSSPPVGTLARFSILNETFDWDESSFDVYERMEAFLVNARNEDHAYYQADEHLLVNISRRSNEFYRSLMQATDRAMSNDQLLMRLQIPRQFWSAIRRSWTNERHCNVLDHLQFEFDGSDLKLIDDSSDQPSIIADGSEAHQRCAQEMSLDYNFMSDFQVHRLLVRAWKNLHVDTCVHILLDDDNDSTVYMKGVMEEAGITSKLCVVPRDLHYQDTQLVDQDGDAVRTVWKRWQWTTIFADHLAGHSRLGDILLSEGIRIIGPLWTSIANHRDLRMASSGRLSKKSGQWGDETILVWMIDGICAGFAIQEDRHRHGDPNTSLTVCCVV